MDMNIADIQISQKAAFRSEFDRELERIEREQPCINSRYGALQTFARMALAQRDNALSRIIPEARLLWEAKPESDIDAISQLADLCSQSILLLEGRFPDDCAELEYIKKAAFELQSRIADNYDDIVAFDESHPFLPNIVNGRRS